MASGELILTQLEAEFDQLKYLSLNSSPKVINVFQKLSFETLILHSFEMVLGGGGIISHKVVVSFHCSEILFSLNFNGIVLNYSRNFPAKFK